MTVTTATMLLLLLMMMMMIMMMTTMMMMMMMRAADVNPSLNNEKAYMRGIGFQTTTADACEISKPYTSGTHEMLIKLGELFVVKIGDGQTG